MNKIIQSVGHVILLPFRLLWMRGIRVDGYIKRKKLRYKCNITKRIVFIANYPQGWNSFKPVYQALKNNQEIEVILLGYVNEKYPSSTKEFWTSIDPNAVIAMVGNIPNISSFSADIVFRQTPYDDGYPKEYYAKEIVKVSKLCYIPYGYQISSGLHLKYEYNDLFFPYLSAIYACNSVTYNYCVKKASSSFLTSDIRVFNYGYPRFDLLSLTDHQNKIASYLWIPRWSVDEKSNNGTGFFKYSKLILDFFKNRQDISLIIRPHPLMFSNFIKQNLMSEEDVKRYKKDISDIPNIKLDESADYLDTFNYADVMIADYSTLIVEFFVSGKPIIYCGDLSAINDEMDELLTFIYPVKDWNELSNAIINFCRVGDSKFVQRQDFIKSHFYKSESDILISEKIAFSCINEI